MKPGQPVSKNDASVLLHAIERKLKIKLRLRQIAVAQRQASPRQADRLKAAQMLAAEILASVARCEALERER